MIGSTRPYQEIRLFVPPDKSCEKALELISKGYIVTSCYAYTLDKTLIVAHKNFGKIKSNF